MSIDKELLAILCCPKCRGEVYLSQGGEGIICDRCRLLYPVIDDIPVMLIEEAKEMK